MKDSYCNTIVLPGMEVVIPLEGDLDCEPLQDDGIRLQSLDLVPFIDGPCLFKVLGLIDPNISANY